MKSVYFGESQCQAKLKSPFLVFTRPSVSAPSSPFSAPSSPFRCQRIAYYTLKNEVRCGYHASKNERKVLPRNPHAKEIRIKQLKAHHTEVMTLAKENQSLGKKGSVRCTKLRMMQTPALIPGYLNVFPNNKHQNRQDGFGCASLSPMRLGPVDHGQPGLAKALNLENFHQGNKVFLEETEEAEPKVWGSKEPEPKQEFFKRQKAMYLDPNPHRHKFPKMKGNKNIPLYSVWVKKDGNLQKCTYIESRQFYCTFYERLAVQTDDFKTLVNFIEKGVNLNIIGYDAPKNGVTDIEKHYLNETEPFGHELVLYTLLTAQPKEYPWRKYTTFSF